VTITPSKNATTSAAKGVSRTRAASWSSGMPGRLALSTASLIWSAVDWMPSITLEKVDEAASSCGRKMSSIRNHLIRETVAIGYPRERMLNSGSGTFGYPLQAPLLTAGDGLDYLRSIDIIRSRADGLISALRRARRYDRSLPIIIRMHTLIKKRLRRPLLRRQSHFCRRGNADGGAAHKSRQLPLVPDGGLESGRT